MVQSFKTMNISLNESTHVCYIQNGVYPIRSSVSSVELIVNYVAAFLVLLLFVLLTLFLNLTAILTFLSSNRLGNSVCFFLIFFQSIIDVSLGTSMMVLRFWQILPAFLNINVNCKVFQIQWIVRFMFFGSSVSVLSRINIERF